MRRTTRLKQLIAAPDIVIMPGVHDALGVRLADADTGFGNVTNVARGAAVSIILITTPVVLPVLAALKIIGCRGR